MQIIKTETDSEVNIALIGSLDTHTSSSLLSTLLPIIESKKSVSLDFSQIVYVSSAGLHVLLLCHKATLTHSTLMIIKNVLPKVMDIFDMTGFSDTLTIIP